MIIHAEVDGPEASLTRHHNGDRRIRRLPNRLPPGHLGVEGKESTPSPNDTQPLADWWRTYFFARRWVSVGLFIDGCQVYRWASVRESSWGCLRLGLLIYGGCWDWGGGGLF